MGASRIESVGRGPDGPLSLLGTLLRPGLDHASPGPVCPALDRADAEDLLIIAGLHLVTPTLWSALRSGGQTALLPDDLAEYLEAMHALNGRRNRRLREQALEIAAALGTAGIRPVFLKGLAALLLDLHRDPAARFIGDIDILLRPDQLEDAARCLQRAGYLRLPDGVPHSHDRLRLTRPDRPAMVELHQSPVTLGLEAIIPTAGIIRRARPASGACPALVPCPDDLVVHNVAHAMLQNRFFRLAELPLRDAFDLAQLADRLAGTIDWPAVERRLAMAPGGGDVLQFYAAATAQVFPGARLPAFGLGTRAARTLARWRRRDGRPPSPLSYGLIHLLEYAEDRAWRVKHVPNEGRYLLGRLASPWAYPQILRSLAGVAAGGPPTPSPGRRRTGTPTRQR